MIIDKRDPAWSSERLAREYDKLHGAYVASCEIRKRLVGELMLKDTIDGDDLSARVKQLEADVRRIDRRTEGLDR